MLISACLSNTDGALFVKGEADAINAGSSGPARTSGEATIDGDGKAVE